MKTPAPKPVNGDALAPWLDQIHVGDSGDLLLKMPGESVDLVVTSPPYDDLRKYGGHVFDWESFKRIAIGLNHVLKVGGVIVWVVGDASKDNSETFSSFRQALFFRDTLDLLAHDTMVYEKTNFANPSHNRYHQLFEYMFVFAKGQPPKTFNPIIDKPNKYKKAFGRNTFRNKEGDLQARPRHEYKEVGMRGNIWKYITGNLNGDDLIAYDHPAIFPQALAADHIRSWSNEGDVILDPFSGSGTVCRMAKFLRRRFIGIDIHAPYVEKIAKPRIAQEMLI
jgi:site-specific DNA-methyltransferase (adenine-specific)